MKLLYCEYCEDVFAVDYKNKKCACKVCSAFLSKQDDGQIIVYYKGEFAVILDFKNEWFCRTSPGTDKTAQKHTKGKHFSGADMDFCTKVLEYLNQVAGTGYSTAYPSSSCSAILLRKKEHKCTFEEFKNIIDNKWEQWKNSNMEIYMRPATLFDKTKFANYLGENQHGTKKSASSFDKFTNIVQSATAGKKGVH